MQITVTETAQTLTARNQRAKLVLRNTGANIIYFGWETSTTASGSTQGVPLEADEVVTLAGRDVDCAQGIILICGAGQTSTLNYTEG
jgi:hypothetical protein